MLRFPRYIRRQLILLTLSVPDKDYSRKSIVHTKLEIYVLIFIHYNILYFYLLQLVQTPVSMDWRTLQRSLRLQKVTIRWNYHMITLFIIFYKMPLPLTVVQIVLLVQYHSLSIVVNYIQICCFYTFECNYHRIVLRWTNQTKTYSEIHKLHRQKHERETETEREREREREILMSNGILQM